MKEGWTYKKLKEICEKGSSNISLNKIEDNFGDYPLYGASGFVKGVDFYHQSEPYIGIVKDGSGVGRVDEYPAQSSLVATMQYIFPKDGCELRFLKYLLMGMHLEKHKTGAAIPHIYFKDYSNTIVPLPKLAEQQQIVSELDLLSDVIEMQKAQIEELDKLAQSTFYDMFGDPVTNDKGWGLTKLGDICETSSGGTPSKSHKEYYEGGTIPWLRSGEVSHGFIYNTELFITEAGMNNSSAKLFPIDTVAVAMYGATVGQVGVLKAEMTTNQAICGIFPNDYYSSIFLLYFLKGMQPVYLKDAAGGAQPNISQGVIKNTKVPMIPLALQQEFAAKIEAIEQMKAKVRQSLKESEELFNSRMDYYFN